MQFCLLSNFPAVSLIKILIGLGSCKLRWDEEKKRQESILMNLMRCSLESPSAAAAVAANNNTDDNYWPELQREIHPGGCGDGMGRKRRRHPSKQPSNQPGHQDDDEMGIIHCGWQRQAGRQAGRSLDGEGKGEEK